MADPNNCGNFQRQREREDEELRRMSESEREQIASQLRSMTLRDALFHFPEGPRRRTLEKIVVCNGETFLCDERSLLEKLEDKGCCVNTEKLHSLRRRVAGMKVTTILGHEDRDVHLIANYLVATSV
jgi:hypothetical protein